MHDPAVQLSVVQLLPSSQLGVILKSKKAAWSAGPFPKSPFTALIHSRKKKRSAGGSARWRIREREGDIAAAVAGNGESCVISVFPLCVLGGALVSGPGPTTRPSFPGIHSVCWDRPRAPCVARTGTGTGTQGAIAVVEASIVVEHQKPRRPCQSDADVRIVEGDGKCRRHAEGHCERLQRSPVQPKRLAVGGHHDQTRAAPVPPWQLEELHEVTSAMLLLVTKLLSAPPSNSM